MNTTLTLEIYYLNLDSKKIKCISYIVRKNVLIIYTFFDRFNCFVEIKRSEVINVFLLQQHNKKVALFK